MPDRSARWSDAARHALCILALMWTALLNGQPFFFPDTSSYVRAGDLAAWIASGHRLSTAWTARYADAADAPVAPSAPRPAATTTAAGANDVQRGNIMSGRSPYFGFLLYLSYVTSRFWLFVIAQAAVAYLLILLSLRHFGLGRPKVVTGMVLALAALASLPYYNSLLLADALASFGILAFLLLATDRGPLRRWQHILLWAVLVASVVSHLTHLAMLAGMAGLLIVLRLGRWAPPLPRRAWAACAIGLGVGVASIMATSLAVSAIFHKPPRLVPLLTARFIADGPGLRFIRDGCDGGRFAVCAAPPAGNVDDTELLWSLDPARGFFMTASPERRELLARQDRAFAVAVLRAYPAREAGMMLLNTARQLSIFQLEGLNQGCFAVPGCWASLPEPVRANLRASLSGRDRWPVAAMSALLYTAVILSLAVILARLPALWRADRARGAELSLWIALAGTAMLTCAFLGGALSEPQYRYQGRLIWLVPFFAGLVLLLGRPARRPAIGAAA